MTQDPEFTQIPLNNQRLLALNDLKAVSGYNRNLIVPDDLPPVLSLPQIQAPLQPHLVTGQEDGSVNVFMTGSNAGGAGLSINTLQQVVEFDLYGSRPGETQASGFFTQHNAVILSMDLFWHWNDLTYSTGGTHEHELRLATNNGSGNVRLAAVSMIGGGNATYPPTGSVQKTVVFPGGLILAPAVVPDVDDQYLIYTHGTGGVIMGVLVTLYLGTTP